MNQLAVDGVHGPAVFFTAGQTAEVKKCFAGLDFFNIPHGCLGSALLKQLFNITIQNFHKKADVPVIDLTSITEAYLAQVGELWSRPLFVWPKDNTHLKYEGAVLMSGFLSMEMKKLGEPYRSLFLEDQED